MGSPRQTAGPRVRQERTRQLCSLAGVRGWLMTAAALVLLLASASEAARPIVTMSDFGPRERVDPREVAASPLDLRSVTFGQRNTRLLLEIRTQRPWSASSLAADALCLSLSRDNGAAVWRICLGATRGKPVLTHQRIIQRNSGPMRKLSTPVARESGRELSATFSARSIELPRGRLRWSVESRWRDDDACAAVCVDRVPDRGEYPAAVSVLAQPACFGAAERDPNRHCSNPSLARTLIPTPGQALLDPGAPCQPIAGVTIARPCEFGDRAGDSAPDVLLVGDSHTNNWRGALNVAAQARGWRGVSMTRPGCALSTEVYPSAPPGPALCRQRNAEAVRWLVEHPSVHTVVTAASAGRGLSARGFSAMFSQLPASVRDIYVIRDVPRARFSTAECVRAIHRRRLPTRRVCAFSRAGAILSDPAFAAAQSGPSRLHAIDLTRHFCDPTRCYPVIGGSYVYIDDNHMNTMFSTTLGPFLLRNLR